MEIILNFKKIWSVIFGEKFIYEISKPYLKMCSGRRKDGLTDVQTQSNIPLQLYQCWGHNKWTRKCISLVCGFTSQSKAMAMWGPSKILYHKVLCIFKMRWKSLKWLYMVDLDFCITYLKNTKFNTVSYLTATKNIVVFPSELLLKLYKRS